MSESECSEFAQSRILDEIQNFSKKLNGQTRQVRFSPRVMRMALSLYLKGPSAYEAFCHSSIQVLPSLSTLKKLKANMTPKEGTFPRCYGWFRDEFFTTGVAAEGDCYGHIVCDEMKLKSDFYWNPSTHQCVGIVVDGGPEDKIDLVKEVQKLYADSVWQDINDEDDENNEHARLFKLLRSGNEPEASLNWLNEQEHVSFPNPADPTRRVAMFHCTTHGLKNMQNALLNSNSKTPKARHFTMGTVKFGWDTVVRTFKRDQKRGGGTTDTSLKHFLLSILISGTRWMLLWRRIRFASTL
jgi:hypothetical protein